MPSACAYAGGWCSRGSQAPQAGTGDKAFWVSGLGFAAFVGFRGLGFSIHRVSGVGFKVHWIFSLGL